MYTEGNTAVGTLQLRKPDVTYSMIQLAETRGDGRRTRGRDLGKDSGGGADSHENAAPRVSAKLGAEGETKGEQMEPGGAAQPSPRFLGRP